LREQIESVLQQRLASTFLLVRDDGSTDGTADLLREYAANPKVGVIFGENVGIVGSFFELLKAAPKAFLYAFCDQDDWWDPGKLERAAGMLERFHGQGPAGVHCGYAVTDESLRIQYYSRGPGRGYSFENALVQNIITGCTLCINSHAREKVVGCLPNTNAVVMHDWWLYLVLSSMGHISYDPQVGVLYRQHGGNVVGAARRGALLMQRLGRVARGGRAGVLGRQAAEFLKCFGPCLSNSQRTSIERLLLVLEEKNSYRRVVGTLQSNVYRQSHLETVILKGLMILGQA